MNDERLKELMRDFYLFINMLDVLGINKKKVFEEGMLFDEYRSDDISFNVCKFMYCNIRKKYIVKFRGHADFHIEVDEFEEFMHDFYIFNNELGRLNINREEVLKHDSFSDLLYNSSIYYGLDDVNKHYYNSLCDLYQEMVINYKVIYSKGICSNN